MRLLLGFLIAASLMVPGVAAANPGPWVQLFEVMQEGQDVSVQIAIITPMHVSLVREDRRSTETLFENRLIGEDAPLEPLCLSIDEAGCDEPDAGCRDCDDDGDEECLDDCYQMHLYEYLDECADPGRTTYELHGEEVSDGHHIHALHINVIDTGDPCLDDTACSVTSVGRSAASHVLALTMLAIGLVAARVGRKQ